MDKKIETVPFIATVVIPTKDRENETNRAIESVLCQNGSDQVKIIVIDDNSKNKIEYKGLRSFDIVVRNKKNVGAAVSRNIGIRLANSELIYLLDSDDYFIERNFLDDYSKYRNTVDLYYTDIIYKENKTSYPDKLELKDFFIYILIKHIMIGQTSSLMFCKENIQIFDEALPRHQDWDLVLNFLLSQKGGMIKSKGLVYYDDTDKNSIARKKDKKTCLPFIEKLKQSSGIDELEKIMFKNYMIRNESQIYPWREWFCDGVKLLAANRMRISLFIKSFIRRIIPKCKR